MKDVFARHVPTLVSCGQPFSFFFDLVEPIWVGENNNPMHRICSLMRKMGVRSILREELEPFSELEEEESDLQVRSGVDVRLAAHRVTFFRSAPLADWRSVPAEDYLGYAIVLTPDRAAMGFRSYVLEAVTRLPSVGPLHGPDGSVAFPTVPNYYIHCCRGFEATVGSREAHRHFALLGTFFCQQNGMTHVCAHAALRTAVNSSPIYAGPKVTNRAINEILKIDHRKRRVGRLVDEQPGGAHGLNADAIRCVAEQLGFEPHFADFTRSHDDNDFTELLYPMIESGFPTMLAIRMGKCEHALAVLGHTINSDRWTPEARNGYQTRTVGDYIGASAWADHLIAADDNYGMYVTLPTDALKSRGSGTNEARAPGAGPDLRGEDVRPLLAIGFLPRGHTVAGYDAEQASSFVANELIRQSDDQQNRWLRVLRRPTHPLVCRTLFQTKASYVASMREAADAEGVRLNAAEVALLQTLPESFWVTELSIPNLMAANKRKLGDVVSLAAAAEGDEPSREKEVVCAWLPGLLWIGAAFARCAHPPESTHAWSWQSHVPILRGMGQPRPQIEW